MGKAGKVENVENVKIKSYWNLPFEHHAGITASRYLMELKENGQFVGSRCPHCKRILVPARNFCERCFVETEDWVPVKDTGTIDTFSINCMKYVGLPDPPYILGLIRLDGADTAILHFIGGIDLSNVEEAAKKIKIGARVEAVWKKKKDRTGAITDVEYFRLVDIS